MLDWEENLFVGLRCLYRMAFVDPAERQRAGIRATLAERRKSLLVLGQLIAGQPLGILETPKILLASGDRLFLPSQFDVAASQSTNALLFELKAILGALALRDGWTSPGAPLAERLAGYAEEFPGLAALWHALSGHLPRGSTLESLFGPPGEIPPGRDASASRSVVPAAETADNPITTEIQGKGQSDAEVRTEDEEDGAGADLPTHTFEKVETLEEYTGESRKSDDTDDLEEHEEALRALDLRQLLRSPERPRSLYRADVILDGAGFEAPEAPDPSGIAYPEWDHRRARLRPDWCRVHPRHDTPADPVWAAETWVRHRCLIHRLRRQFASVTSDWLRLRRQPVGDELDLDAVVDAEVGRRTGRVPDENLCIERRRSFHEVAVLILLDASYSTDSWIGNRRVLDVITETVFCAGEVLAPALDEFAVAAFSSNTRRSCWFDHIKRFHQPWVDTRGRLGSVRPNGYTRIGPALRHGQHLLLRRRASRKLVLLITDGRPCDYDRYEGAYGIHDVRQAIEAGLRHGIHTHAFAVDQHATEQLPRMFTRHNYDILPRPERLAQAMCRLFARVLAR